MSMLLISCLLIGSISCGPVDKEYAENSAGTSFMRQPFSSGTLSSGMGVSSNPSSSSPFPSLPNPSSDNIELPAPQDASSSAGPGSYRGTNMAVGNAFGGYASVGAPVGSSAGGYDGSASAGYGFDSSAPGGSSVGGYDGSASAGYGFDTSAPGGSSVGGYDGSASAGYGFDTSAPGGSYAGGYDGSASAGYGFDSSAPGGSYATGYDSSASAYVGDAWSSGSAYGYDAGDALEPVFSDVSDLEPVYSFSSRSSYQHGGAVFAQTRYTPGEPVPQYMPARRTSKQSSPAKAPTKGAF